MSKELWNPGYRRELPTVALANGDVKNKAFRAGGIEPLTEKMLLEFGISTITVQQLKEAIDRNEKEHNHSLGLGDEPPVVRGIRPSVYVISAALAKAEAFIEVVKGLNISKLPFFIVFNDAVWSGGDRIYNKPNGSLDVLLTDLRSLPDKTEMSSNTATVVVPPNIENYLMWEFYFSSLQVGNLRREMLYRYPEIALPNIAMGLGTLTAIREGIIRPKDNMIQINFYRLSPHGKFNNPLLQGSIANADTVFSSQISPDSANNPLIVNASLGTMPINDVLLLSNFG